MTWSHNKPLIKQAKQLSKSVAATPPKNCIHHLEQMLFLHWIGLYI